MRILLVEDDPTLVELLADSLSLLGHKPFTATTAETALAKLPLVEAAIVDGLNGGCWNVLTWAARMGIPSVLFSGSRNLVENARDEGFQAILKPAKMEKVLAALGVGAEVGELTPAANSKGEQRIAAGGTEGAGVRPGPSRTQPFFVDEFYDPDEPPETCQHCGKDYEDFSDMGCGYCDQRSPEWGMMP